MSWDPVTCRGLRTLAQYQEIVKAKQSGRRVVELAEEFGITPCRIYQIIKLLPIYEKRANFKRRT